MVIKNAISPKWTGANHMPVGQDISSLRINDKSGSLAAHGQVGIKRGRLTEMNRNYALDNLFNRGLPFRRICLCLAQREHTRIASVIPEVI
jgi:hypothetical protein